MSLGKKFHVETGLSPLGEKERAGIDTTYWQLRQALRLRL